MKKIIVVFIVILIVFSLSGCAKMNHVTDHIPDDTLTSFLIAETYTSGVILVDRDTNVMYWMSKSSYNIGNLTLLVDENGNPKIYKEK